MALIPIQSLRDMLKADDRVQEYGEAAIERARTTLAKENVFSRLVSEGEKENGLTPYEIAYEAAGFIVAGSGTTAVTLTYLVWAVLSHPSIQTLLEAEVAELQPGFDDSNLEALPFLGHRRNPTTIWSSTRQSPATTTKGWYSHRWLFRA
jgi:cytochrome P450